MLKPGMFIAERYEIIDTVGSGGMADVYKARCHKLNRFVAIKVLKQEFSTDEGFVDKFKAEAQSAAGLQHPNIVNVYDVGEENGMHYIVMELIEGITLKNFIERKGRLDVREATGIAIQIAQGLEAAHDNNIIHRDIKPQNIIISRDGKVKVADFGIAKAASSNTLTSSAMGSVHYISPEQARGGYSDEKSDVYSLGITMYEMISGKVPFEGDNAVSIALLHIQEEIMPLGEMLGDIPISTDKIVLKCLQKKPERRYLSVVELISDLKRSLVEPGVDFVVIPDVLNNSPTIALSPSDVNAIRNGAMQSQGPDNMMHQDMMYHGMTMNESMIQGNMQNNNMNNNMNYNMDGNNYPNYGNQQFPVNNEYNDDFIDPDEEKVDDKLEKITKIGAVIIVIFIIVIVLFLLTQGKGGNNDEPEVSTEPTITASFPDDTMVDVELVEGKKFKDAEKILLDQGFLVSPKYVPAPEASYDGYVKKQYPPAGTPWRINTTITLEVYKVGATEEEVEEKEYTMIPLEGVPLPDAINKLTSLFEGNMPNVDPKPVYDDNVPINVVIKTKPSAGSKVKNTQKIEIIYSMGPDKVVKVPNLIGLPSIDAARTELKNVGLQLGEPKEGYDPNYPNGAIIAQGHRKDSKVNRGDEISVTVNVIPENPQPPEPEPEVQEKEYTIVVAFSLPEEDLFEPDSERPVKASCVVEYNGYSYNSKDIILRKGAYTGDASMYVTIKSKEEINDGDIQASNVSLSLDNALEGASSKAVISVTIQ